MLTLIIRDNIEVLAVPYCMLIHIISLQYVMVVHQVLIDILESGQRGEQIKGTKHILRAPQLAAHSSSGSSNSIVVVLLIENLPLVNLKNP